MRDLRAPTIPVGVPDHMVVLLRLLERKLRDGDAVGSWAATRDALGLLTRYFSGVLPAAWRSLSSPPPEVITLWREGKSTGERVELVHRCLTALLRMRNDSLARVLIEAFAEGDPPVPLVHTRLLGLGAPVEGMPPLADWFAQTAETPPAPECERQLLLYLPVLDVWLQRSARYFQDCDHRFETGTKFGQMELVVRFREKLLKTGFSLRLREGRKSGAVAPSPTSSGSIHPPAPNPGVQESEELTRLIVSMLHREHTPTVPPPRKKEEPPPEPEEAPAPIVSRLKHRVHYMGPARNQGGTICFRGRIDLWMSDMKEFSGQARASHPKVTLRPASFSGTRARLDYWIDPSAMAEGQKEYLILHCDGEIRKLPLATLLPSSKIPNLTNFKAAMLLLAPALLFTGYVLFRFWYSLHKVHTFLNSSTSREFQLNYLGRQPVSLGGGGVSTLDVDVLPLVESTLIFYFLLAVVCPLVVTKLFARLPARQQGDLGFVYVMSMLMPVMVVACLLTGTGLSSPLFIHPELRPMSFGLQFPFFAGLNLASSAYLFASVTGVVDRLVKDRLLRAALPLLLMAGVGLTIMIRIYGG